MDKNKEKDRLFQPAGGRLLQQSVLKHIRRRADGIVEGAALGYDAAIFQSGDSLILQGIGAQPTLRFDETASLTAGEAAWITAENQLAACGVAMYRGTMVQVLLAAGMSCPEERIRREMQRLSALSTERSCPIVGGNTVFHGRGDSLLIQVVMTAHLAADRNQRRKPAAGDRVFFLGETGCLGADLLARRCREKLRERFSESYIASMEAEKQRFSTIEMSRIAYESGAVYLHDVSNCGVHAALYQLAEAAGTGIRIQSIRFPDREKAIIERYHPVPIEITYRADQDWDDLQICMRIRNMQSIGELGSTLTETFSAKKNSGCFAFSILI